ncbi:cytokine-dependent hematopoietic cell linker isoform X2 [Periophthalmus magnuspinnatus]|uniref:cytokine-dependent hematopoietic cell linker isoform X2 n=1 Tax=Periophthalmus magnuspinnatus TaxID=409849 RepID=UPI0024365FB8|nr:cytokine-dependent hematopoietic cell linker isoform X2 [Periophthalmus magnuspinnatus]
MEDTWTQWRLKQRHENQADILEPYYDVVDDQETVHNVHIQPARPINEEREYIDRDLPRSSSAQSLSSDLASGGSKIHPTYPPRKTTTKQAPSVNRDMKPGKRKHVTANLQSIQHRGPSSSRCPPSPHFPLELMEQLNCMTLQESTKRQRQRPAKNVSSQSSNSKGSHAERARFSIDMEAQHIAERWSNEALDIEHDDDTDVKLQHDHQWPQIKDVVDQHDFKEPQIHKEDIWYIGPCKRTDAEHALHLVNKDGAFLVRDCSLCSSSEPFVLSVFHEKKVYNVKIRFLESHRKYALGRGQRCNEMFYSVSDIIKFHSIFPIVLISGKNLPGGAENCVLTFPVTKEDVERLLQ